MTDIKSITAGKSGNLASLCKPLLVEQHQRLASKNSFDLDLIDDLRSFIKVKCNIEKDYAQALIKLISHHQKKYPQFAAETDSDVKSVYSAWKSYLDDVDQVSKARLTEFDQISKSCDQLKEIRSHKSNIAKKQIDHHLKKMQDEVNQTVVELDKHRKFYLEEEHVAKKARDTEEKLMKRKGGIFSKFTDLQGKKEKSSAQREATEIESTHARNEYILSLASANAHLNHFFTLDVPSLLKTMDDEALDKCRDLALEAEITKWMSCFSKECRNLSRLSAQLVKCLNLHDQGHKTVEVRGVGQVNLESQIDEIKQQIRKCDVSKSKAYSRLNAVRESGMTVEDLDALETTINQEMKQQLNSLGIETGDTALSRTPSLRSTKIGEDGRASAAENKSFSDNDNENPTPEPDNYMNQSHDYDDDSDERDLSTPALNNGNNGQQYDNTAQDWGAGGWEETPAWQETPAAEPSYQAEEQPVQEQAYETSESYATETGYNNNQELNSYDQAQNNELTSSYDTQEPAIDHTESYFQHVNVGTDLVGKLCRALYAYAAQNEDDLELLENDEVTVTSATDADWVTAQNSQGETGFVPAAYLEVIGEAPSVQEFTNYSNDAAVGEMEPVAPQIPEILETQCMQAEDDYVRALYDYEATSGEEISFAEGELIKIVERSEDGWWTGEKDNGVRGHFPSMLVGELDGHEEEEEVSEEEEEEAEVDEYNGGCESSLPPNLPVAAPPSQHLWSKRKSSSKQLKSLSRALKMYLKSQLSDECDDIGPPGDAPEAPAELPPPPEDLPPPTLEDVQSPVDVPPPPPEDELTSDAAAAEAMPTEVVAGAERKDSQPLPPSDEELQLMM
ncbi:F-BAR and double SH3 domains protein 2 [Halotydeus destructor]|nr:F-BAR and double SH3 domains protein 2 [Halotydeus destructor]